MEKSKHLQDQLKELKTEIESLKLEEQQQQAGHYNLRSEARGYVPEPPVYIPHSNVRMITLCHRKLRTVSRFLTRFEPSCLEYDVANLSIIMG